jgi:hypothetical protein
MVAECSPKIGQRCSISKAFSGQDHFFTGKVARFPGKNAAYRFRGFILAGLPIPSAKLLPLSKAKRWKIKGCFLFLILI